MNRRHYTVPSWCLFATLHFISFHFILLIQLFFRALDFSKMPLEVTMWCSKTTGECSKNSRTIYWIIHQNYYSVVKFDSCLTWWQCNDPLRRSLHSSLKPWAVEVDLCGTGLLYALTAGSKYLLPPASVTCTEYWVCTSSSLNDNEEFPVYLIDMGVFERPVGIIPATSNYLSIPGQ